MHQVGFYYVDVSICKVNKTQTSNSSSASCHSVSDVCSCLSSLCLQPLLPYRQASTIIATEKSWNSQWMHGEHNWSRELESEIDVVGRGWDEGGVGRVELCGAPSSFLLWGEGKILWLGWKYFLSVNQLILFAVNRLIFRSLCQN